LVELRRLTRVGPALLIIECHSININNNSENSTAATRSKVNVTSGNQSVEIVVLDIILLEIMVLGREVVRMLNVDVYILR